MHRNSVVEYQGGRLGQSFIRRTLSPLKSNSLLVLLQVKQVVPTLNFRLVFSPIHTDRLPGNILLSNGQLNKWCVNYRYVKADVCCKARRVGPDSRHPLYGVCFTSGKTHNSSNNRLATINEVLWLVTEIKTGFMHSISKRNGGN